MSAIALRVSTSISIVSRSIFGGPSKDIASRDINDLHLHGDYMLSGSKSQRDRQDRMYRNVAILLLVYFAWEILIPHQYSKLCWITSLSSSAPTSLGQLTSSRCCLS